MSRLRLRSVVLASLTLLFGLHTFRVYLPTVIWYLGQHLSATGLVLYAVATFALTLLTPVVQRALGEGGALAVAIGGLAVTRLAMQFVTSPVGDLVLATAGLGLLGGFLSLWCLSLHNIPAADVVPGLALAFPMAFLIDTGSRTLLLSYDLAWRGTLGATSIIVALVLLTLLLLWRELADHSSQEAASAPLLGRVLPLVGLGPWLYVSQTITHNSATWMAWSGWNERLTYLAVNLFAAVGALACVFVAAGSLRRRQFAAVPGGALLVGSLALLIAGTGPSWLWLGLALVTSWAALGGVLTGSACSAGTRPRVGQTALVVFLALLILLALVVLVGEYELMWMEPVAGGLLAVAATLASQGGRAPRRPQLGIRVALVGGTALVVLVVVGSWSALKRYPAAADRPAERPLRVMTYNIHHGVNSHNQVNLSAIAAVIRAEDPDVIALNEVNRGRASNGFVDTLPFIAGRLGMDYVFGANYRDGRYGNAILSRYPVLAWNNIHFTHNTTEVRGLLSAVIQAPGGPLTIYVTHLDHLRGSDNVRAQQVAEALAAWGGDPRAILLGDLNAEPESPELQSIYASGFLDVLAVTGQEDAFTFWDPMPSRRIDFIFLTPDLVVERAWVVPSRASDHLPVLAEIGM